MQEYKVRLVLLLVGIVVSVALAEAAFYWLNRSAQAYPLVIYETEQPGLQLWCYDEQFQGVADWDLREEHPFSELIYLHNMDFDSTLVDLDPLAVPMAIEVRLNSDGFRGRPLPAVKAKASRAELTLVVGDSFCFGQGVRLEDRLSNRIETRLNAEGNRHLLANLCKNGADLIRIFLTTKKSVEYFGEVKRVFYVYTINDAIQDSTTSAMNKAIDDFMHYRASFLRQAYGPLLDGLSSQILRFFATQKFRDRISHDTLAWYRRIYSDENQGWGYTQKILHDMAVFCRDRGLEFTVAIFPVFYQLEAYPFTDIHDRLGAFAAEEQIEWIDLLPLFAGKDERDYWVHPRDFHPNTYAHREAADFLYDAVDW